MRASHALKSRGLGGGSRGGVLASGQPATPRIEELGAGSLEAVCSDSCMWREHASEPRGPARHASHALKTWGPGTRAGRWGAGRSWEEAVCRDSVGVRRDQIALSNIYHRVRFEILFVSEYWAVDFRVLLQQCHIILHIIY